MQTAIKRPAKHKNDRSTNLEVNLPQPTAAIRITGATVSGPSLTLVFNQIVMLEGLPGFGVNVGLGNVVQANQTAPHSVEIVYSAPITGATSVDVGFRDPAIRNGAGGYVVATNHVFA